MLVVGAGDREEFRAGDHTQLRELLHPSRQQVALRYSLAHASLEPGRASLPHKLQTSEVYYILSGRGEMNIDDEIRSVVPGDTVYIPPGSTQSISSTGSEPLTFLCIVDPAWQAEDEEILGTQT